MCGRYALALRPAQVRRMLQEDNLPVDEAPGDDDDGEGGDDDDDDGDDGADDGTDDGGADAPRQTYNFAPGNHGIVYRADVPDWGAGPKPAKSHGGARGNQEHGNDPARSQGEEADRQVEVGEHVERERQGLHHQPRPSQDGGDEEKREKSHHDHTRYKLQSMRWGLIPSWTKRKPDYASMLKTINCRDDSLAGRGGLWATMKARKRCIVVAQGFYEWLTPDGEGSSSKHKTPHYVKRKDGRLMCFAGLWDCVRYEDADGAGDGGGKEDVDDAKAPARSVLYTYTIITTSSNAQLRFLHDRMPVIVDQVADPDALRTWLDPGRREWDGELQALLHPYAGELEVYPVSKEVGKVSNDSPSFVVPVASRENKQNIANFFANAKSQQKQHGKADVLKGAGGTVKAETEEEQEQEQEKVAMPSETGLVKTEPLEDGGREREVGKDNDGGGGRGDVGSPALVAGVKREAPSPSPTQDEPKSKKITPASKPAPKAQETKQPAPSARPTRSATANRGRSPTKGKGKGKGKSETGQKKITKFFGNPT